MNWIDDFPLMTLALLAIILGLAPFVPEPHLFEKAQMLVAGTLIKPMDIFDSLMHGTPMALLVVKLGRVAFLKVI